MIKIKTENQVQRIRESCHVLAKVLKSLEQHVVPGVTTKQLDTIARKEIEAYGGRPAFLGYMGFPATLCTSVNEEVIHGIPGSRKLVEGDVISIDCGVELNGAFSDSAVTLPVGNVSNSVEQLLRTTNESLYKGIEQMIPGNRIKDISRAISSHVQQKNYGIVYEYCGHGVGIDIHEDPQVPNYVGPGPNPRLKNGMVLAIEPMITLGEGDVDVLDDDWTVVTSDGSISAHFEHTVLIWNNTFEILTEREGV